MTPLPQTIVQSHMLDIFCPLAEDIGNLADWAAVAVALFGAIAVFQLSRGLAGNRYEHGQIFANRLMDR